MGVLIQLAVLVVLTAGLGYWFWLIVGKPEPWSGLAWLWCGLGGFCLGLLLLQVLVYLDWPLRQTAPWLVAAAAGGVVCGGIGWWRKKHDVGGRRVREARWILAAGVIAGAGHAVSLVGVGADRFIGLAQIDQVNYVATAQFLADEKFSTDVKTLGFRPWLWRALEMKEDRITECVALGTVATVSGADAQRAWGATAVFFIGLLAMALAGMWRVAAQVPAWAASVLGVVGALTPVVAHVFLVGFFSQLTSLFVFPALIAVLRPGALPRKTAVGVALALLGFLAGAYTEFWPIGLGVFAGAMVAWKVGWPRRVALVAGAAAGSALLTGAYVVTLAEALVGRSLESVQRNPELNSGFVPDGITWAGWGRYFFTASGTGAELLGGLVALGIGLACVVQASRRRRYWLGTLAVPVGLLLYFLLQPQRPVYATYKLIAEFSPIFFGLAVVGWMGLGTRAGAKGRLAAGCLVALAGLGAGVGAVQAHWQLVVETRQQNEPLLGRLWAARERVEQAPVQNYLIAKGDRVIGAWMAYFARGSQVYYDLPAVSDRRAPSEVASFRKIPAGVTLEWLDLNERGPVVGREPSPTVHVAGVRGTFESKQRQVQILGRKTEVVITRAAGFSAAEREFFLEGGITVMPGVGPCRVVMRRGDAVVAAMTVTAAMPLRVALRLGPGRHSLVIEVEPASGAATERDWVMLQALSIERANPD